LPQVRFIKTNQNKFTQSVYLNATRWQNETGTKKLLSHFSDQAYFLIDSKIHIFPKEENDKIWQKKMKVIIKQITDAFEANKVRYVVANASEWPGNFAKQVIDYAVVNDADLIMIMTSSEPTLPMFDTWDEQIIFNSSQIPVMCINPARVKKIKFAGSSEWSGF
jgi:hypothetical protein